MKKGLFCVMLSAASLVSGWCFADWYKWCSDEVSNNCTGTVDGKEPLGGGVIVPCNLTGTKLAACKDTTIWHLWFCNETEPCSGMTSAGNPCRASEGAKGCKEL